MVNCYKIGPWFNTLLMLRRGSGGVVRAGHDVTGLRGDKGAKGVIRL
jgi:hypothetical protein